jgi:hypothetical protein
MTKRWRCTWTVVVAAVACTAYSASAQAAVVRQVATMPTDSSVKAITARSEGAIRGDLQLARDALERAERQRTEAEAAVSNAKARLDVRKKEIELTGKQIDLAKREKNEQSRAAYERDKKVQEQRKQLVEAEIAMAEARVSVVQGRRDLARDEIQALERELELGSALPAQLESVQRKLLESLEKVGSRREELGKRERSLVEKQLKLLDAARAIAR